MDVRVLDLDGSLREPFGLPGESCPVPLRSWGPRLRLGCSFAAFRRFETDLARHLGAADTGPALCFAGSGDFHHVSLALVRRLGMPFNLLVLDNHPDWMRGLPFLHCGTWLYHASRLPLCRQIFHVGGDVDFDNHFRWLAPWQALRSGRLTVFPAVRFFRGRAWERVPHFPLRPFAEGPVTATRLDALLEPHREELAARPLYVSLDKDVMTADEAVVNWDSGHLHLPEVLATLAAFLDAAGGNLAGMDVVGDWSPVRARGLFRKALHWTEHPALQIDPERAALVNRRTNGAILEALWDLGVLSREHAGTSYGSEGHRMKRTPDRLLAPRRTLPQGNRTEAGA
jgi:hypothetical protein